MRPKHNELEVGEEMRDDIDMRYELDENKVQEETKDHKGMGKKLRMSESESDDHDNARDSSYMPRKEYSDNDALFHEYTNIGYKEHENERGLMCCQFKDKRKEKVNIRKEKENKGKEKIYHGIPQPMYKVIGPT